MQAIRLAAAVVGSVGVWVIGSGAFPQQEKPQEEQIEKQKQAEEKQKKAEEKQIKTEEKSKKAALKKLTLQLVVTAEGKSELPPESRITLTGKDKCGDLQDQESRLSTEGKATFHDVPECKVTFRIMVSGFETKIASVDLAKRKDPQIRIQVKVTGPPVVE